MITVAAQPALFEGFEEEDDLSTSFAEFRRLSLQEEGLVTGAQAADILGVSSARVTQIGDAGVFSTWEFWGRRYYSLKQVAERRVGERNKGGRPRTTGQMLVVGAKLVRGMTLPQARAVLCD